MSVASDKLGAQYHATSGIAWMSQNKPGVQAGRNDIRARWLQSAIVLILFHN
jgi:hypothetical protein